MRYTLVSTFTGNCEYSCSKRENLPLPIQMQLSQKPDNCCRIFIAFLESRLNSEHFEKKRDFHSSTISEVIDSEKRAFLSA